MLQLTNQRSSRVLVATLLTAAGAHVACAQVQSLFTMDRADLKSFFVDPKDQKIVAALGLLPARVDELRNEIPDMPPEMAPVIKRVLRTIAAPARFSITFNPNNPAGGMFGYGIVLSSRVGTEGDAKALHETISGIVQDAAEDQIESKPSERFPGMTEFGLPFGLLSFGPRQAKDGWSFDIIAGSVDDPDAAFVGFTAPAIEGVSKPFVSGALDFGALTPAANFINTMADDAEGREILKRLTNAGLVGLNALKATYAFGHTAEATRGRVVVENASKLWSSIGIPKGELAAADYAAVPSDATSAMLSRADFGVVLKLIEVGRELGAPVDEFLMNFADETGVDLVTDIFSTLGGSAAIYTSDSTGGGGLGSTVAMITFSDRPKFLSAHQKLLGKANELRELIPDGMGRYIRVASWAHDGMPIFSVRFPGLPVPLELSWTATDRWLIAGLTPQAVIAAAKQATGKGDNGLLAIKDVAAHVKEGRALYSFSYTDTARSLRDGYFALSMLGCTISNMVRSPDGEREPGLLVPSYKELAAGAKPRIALAYWTGEKLTLDYFSDRSALVNAGAAVGGLLEGGVSSLIGAALQSGALDGRNFEEPAFDEIAAWLTPERQRGLLPLALTIDPASWLLYGVAELAPLGADPR